MADMYIPSGLVKDWRERYINKWATDFHITMLLSLNIINQRDADYIKTGK
ncbi:hypothetical protein P5F55_13670 [Clostridium perfringens]|nr:hypothetical protein [Clostridium perfringens]MDK0834971.1 hypothetical protein [Clostridium perfringens]MDK0928409.1 hypothetical protein [Clostridium perfringens]MDM0495367.1 hypothetical protein [Clostridium perfringens]MDM0781081.1 hypothetical protein [Clostridium perfringens]